MNPENARLNGPLAGLIRTQTAPGGAVNRIFTLRGEGQARSTYSKVSVLTMIASSEPTKGGTVMRTPLSRIAGL